MRASNDKYAEWTDQAREMIDRKMWRASEIAQELGCRPKQCSEILRKLATRNEAFIDKSGPPIEWRWGSLRIITDLIRRRANYDLVRMPARAEWLMPAPVVEVLDGVRITRVAAPRGRFDVDLPPGGGVISSDWRASRGVDLAA